MVEGNLGSLIRELRISLDMSQHALSEGICTQAFISKVEKGSVIPSLEIAFKLGQKLNVPLDYIVEKLNYPNFDHYQEMNYQIRRLLRERNYEEIYELVKMEKKHRLMNINIYFKQLILWLEGISSYYILKDYRKSIDLLNDALHLTMNPYRYSEREIEIINSIGIIQCENGNLEEALSTLMMATKSINKLVVIQEKTLKIKVLYNTAKVLTLLKQYEESNHLCSQGMQLCNSFEFSYLLGELYYQMGYNHKLLGSYKQAATFLEKSIQVFEIQKHESFVEQAITHLKFVQEQLDLMESKI